MRRCDAPIGMKPVPGAMRKQFAIYILTNRPRGVLYTGMSSSLAERVRQQKEDFIPGFTNQYHLTRLVYFECLDSAEQTVAREKRLKRWRENGRLRSSNR